MLYSLSYIFFAIQLASAIPLSQLTQILPRDVAYVALDEHRGRLEAYGLNGTHFGTYSPGKAIHEPRKLSTDCAPMAADEMKTIPGYQKVLRYLDDHYGGGDLKLVANPYEQEKTRKNIKDDELESYRTMTLKACVDDTLQSLRTKEKETCRDDDATFEGKISGADGQMRLGVSSTVTNDALWTTTRASSLAAGIKFTMEATVGGIATVGGSANFEFKLTNTATKGEVTQITDTVDAGLWVVAPAGKHCSSSLKSKTCVFDGQAKVAVVATGWIWAYYGKAVKDKMDKASTPHYKWAVNLDQILSQEERSSYLEAYGNIKARTKVNYVATCE